MPDRLTLNLAAVTARFQSAMGRYSQRIYADVAKATRAQVMDMRHVLVTTTPVDRGYLRAHWGPVEEVSTGSLMTYRVRNPTEYGPLLEYGGYRRVGPRTVALGGGDLGEGFVAASGIYSKQAPLGFVRRALANAGPPYRLRIGYAMQQAWPYKR